MNDQNNLTDNEIHLLDFLLENIDEINRNNVLIISESDFKFLKFKVSELILFMNKKYLTIDIKTTKLKRATRNFYFITMTPSGKETIKIYKHGRDDL